jgi:hypothetical protein
LNSYNICKEILDVIQELDKKYYLNIVVKLLKIIQNLTGNSIFDILLNCYIIEMSYRLECLLDLFKIVIQTCKTKECVEESKSSSSLLHKMFKDNWFTAIPLE